MHIEEVYFRSILDDYFRKSYARDGYVFEYFDSQEFPWQDGFNSEAVFGRIFYRDQNDNQKHTQSFAIKVIPKLLKRRAFIELTFTNEIYFYHRILPYFGTLSSSVLALFPKFFYGNVTLLDRELGSIILENLNEDGFRASPKKTFLDADHLLLIVRKLGQFHAYSYQAKAQDPGKFHSLIENLVDTNPAVTGEGSGNFQKLSDHYLDMLLEDTRYTEKVRAMQVVLRNVDQFMMDVRSQQKEPAAVLCHGDFLRNNLLFKYDPVSQKPIDCKFVDLASAKYCTPASDLASLLYMNSDQHTRDEYWDLIIDTYYEALRNVFPENRGIPSKSQIIKEFYLNSFHAYIGTTFFVPMMMEADANPGKDFFESVLRLPEFEEYKHHTWMTLPPEISLRVLCKATTNTVMGEKVLDVLRDIADRDFV